MGEDMWLKLGTGLFTLAMLVMIWPRARVMMREGRKGSTAEWKAAIIPLLAVVGFVVLLVLSV